MRYVNSHPKNLGLVELKVDSNVCIAAIKIQVGVGSGLRFS